MNFRQVIIKRFPNYLLQDLPTFYDTTRNVRNYTFTLPNSNHEYYDKSFVPASTQLWNDLPLEIRGLRSYKALKSKIKQMHANKVPKYFYYGKRTQNIFHTKLRLGCSDINFDKNLIGLIPNNLCTCNLNEPETANLVLYTLSLHFPRLTIEPVPSNNRFWFLSVSPRTLALLFKFTCILWKNTIDPVVDSVHAF